MTAPDRIWLQFSFDMLDKHDDHPFLHSEPYHHQRTVDELLAMAERLEALCSSHAAKVGPQHAWWDDIFTARALIAKHRKGG